MLMTELGIVFNLNACIFRAVNGNGKPTEAKFLRLDENLIEDG